MPNSFESTQPMPFTTSPKMLPSDPKRFSAPSISISSNPEPQSPPTSPKFTMFINKFLRRGDSASMTETLTHTTTASTTSSTSTGPLYAQHADTFPQSPTSTTPRSSFAGRRSETDNQGLPRRFLSVGSNDTRSRSRSRSRDPSRSRSRSPAPRVASIDHVGRHSNDWLFGGFSLSRRSSERER